MATKHVNPVQVQKFLRGVDYPARKEELVDVADLDGADNEILDTLERLPSNTSFEKPTDVTKAIAQEV